jgi:tRNA pseudouridine55 synthase
MLPICLGEATKVSGYLLDSAKSYRVTGRLGIATDTGDADGTVIEERAGFPIDAASVAAAVSRFVGRIQQVPPMYSALKHDGRRLYELARRGVEVERAPRTVEIYELGIESYRWPDLELFVRCSKGTYVRTLVTEIAAALDTVAHVTALRRLGVEPFDAEPMHGLDALAEIAEHRPADLDALLLGADRALEDWPAVTLDVASARRLRQGQCVAAPADWRRGATRVYGPADTFLGIGEVRDDAGLVPRRLFASPRLGDG